MRIIRLNKEQLKYFKDMDPFNIGKKLDFDNYFAVGALVHNNAKNVDVPMGLMICSLIYQGLVVEWLCVGERFRNYGIGEKLLVTAFDMAAEIGAGKIYAYINEYSEPFTNSQIAYLEDRLFTEEYPVSGEWLATVEELKNKKLSVDKALNLVPISKYSGKELKKVFKEYALLDNTVFVYPFEAEDKAYNPEHSFLLTNGKKLCGGLFTKKVGGSIQVTAISVNNISEAEALFAAFINSITDKVDAKTVVSLMVRQKPQAYDWYNEPEVKVDYTVLEEFANKVFGQRHYSGRYLAASIYEYIDDIGVEVNLDVWDDLAYEVLEEVKQG